MKIEEYMIRSGTPQDIDALDLSDNVKFLLKSLPIAYREQFNVIDLMFLKYEKLHLATLPEEEIYKFFVKNALLYWPSYLKHGKVMIIDVVDNHIKIVTEREAAVYFSLEAIVLVPIVTAHFFVSKILKFKERLRK